MAAAMSPASHLILQDAVTPPAPAFRGAITTRKERLVSAARLKELKYFSLVTSSLATETGLHNPLGGRSLRGTPALLSGPHCAARWVPAWTCAVRPHPLPAPTLTMTGEEPPDS
jgi:hypothetical protein